MIETYKFVCAAELINNRHADNADNRQTQCTWTGRKIGVSLEPWALFVNIVVSEIEQKTILQFKPLKIYFFIELLPWHEEKSATDHANKTYNLSKCVCLLETI